MSETRFPWRTLLFVSVALNLLVVGAVAGAWSAGVRLEREASQRAIVERMPGPRAFLGALPPETRAVMREKLADSWVETREARQAAVQARRDAFAAAAQEPFDAPRVRTAFERVRAADQAIVGVFQEDVIEAFGELTPEQRRDVLIALRNAAPARREGAIAPAEGDGEALNPQRRQDIQDRRQERRERFRERRQERLRQQNPPQP